MLCLSPLVRLPHWPLLSLLHSSWCLLLQKNLEFTVYSRKSGGGMKGIEVEQGVRQNDGFHGFSLHSFLLIPSSPSAANSSSLDPIHWHSLFLGRQKPTLWHVKSFTSWGQWSSTYLHQKKFWPKGHMWSFTRFSFRCIYRYYLILVFLSLHALHWLGLCPELIIGIKEK